MNFNVAHAAEPSKSAPILLFVFYLSCAMTLECLGQQTDARNQYRSQFLENNCVECHSSNATEAGIRLETEHISGLAADKETDLLRHIFRVIKSGEMPPENASQHPGETELERLASDLKTDLLKRSPVGGTLPRRLNRIEYQNTIRSLFELPDFQLPESFPSDEEYLGFDNVGQGLVLSPPLMNQYLEVATAVADQIVPPLSTSKPPPQKRFEVGAAGLSTSEGAGARLEGRQYRLAGSRNMASSAGWPVRFEAAHSGVYRIRIVARPYQTSQSTYPKLSESLRLTVYARKSGEQVYAPFSDLRKLQELEVIPRLKEQSFEFDAELMRGEIFGLRWSNGPAFSDPPSRLFSKRFLGGRLAADKRLYAALLEFGGGKRGTPQKEYYDQVVNLMNSDALDLDDERLNELPTEYGGGLSDLWHNWIKAFVHEELLRFGPALDIVDVSVEGPSRLIEDAEAKEQKLRTARFTGLSIAESKQSAELSPRAISERNQKLCMEKLASFLPIVFRRPISENQLQQYQTLIVGYQKQNPDARLEDMLHLAIRRALVSPHFLFRCLGPETFDDFDFASRLSYFLTSAPPDKQLAELAKSGGLRDPKIRRSEIKRLLQDPRHLRFVRNFTGQWLDTRKLKDIMPDPRLLKFFDPDRVAMIEEVELFFEEILKQNLPLRSFIAPDFAFRNQQLNKIYGTEFTHAQMLKTEVAPTDRHAGLLGMAAVMMATANGVDTQPILRGAWMLENILGIPTPEPPDDVPAIGSNTSSAQSIAEQIAAHRAAPACARCHDKIDPLGFVLENFDPVGRWRDNYAVYTKNTGAKLSEEFYSQMGKQYRKGPKVEPASEIWDGTKFTNVADFKSWLLQRMELFTYCLASKMMIYATGRPLSFGDEQELSEIVSRVVSEELGLEDLVVLIVESEAFATR